MLSISHTKKYFNKATPSEVLALNDVSLQIPQAEFLVIIGSNGSGKSTLLNLVAGNILPDEGDIFIDGKNVSAKKDFQRSKWISRVFQDPLKGTAPDLS